MTRSARTALAFAILAFAVPAAARAQTERDLRLFVNPYIGAFAFDDDELGNVGREANIGVILGGRLGWELARAWAVEAGYGFATFATEDSEFDDQFDEAEVDVDAHLLYGAIDYFIFSDEAPTRLLLTAGLGTIILSGEDSESDADFLATFGVGFTHPVRPWITFRGEVRDHIGFCSAQSDANDDELQFCFDDEPLNNFEISGGLEFWVY